uniref:Secreted protein n=1 Tax=Anopheles darlingi TaxID=43151 RepID=A0A2M4D7C4_ANODA
MCTAGSCSILAFIFAPISSRAQSVKVRPSVNPAWAICSRSCSVSLFSGYCFAMCILAGSVFGTRLYPYAIATSS